MPKYDVYLYEDCKVLNDKLNIKDGEALDLAEAALSRANMMILYSSGFSDFSVKHSAIIRFFQKTIANKPQLNYNISR